MARRRWHWRCSECILDVTALLMESFIRGGRHDAMARSVACVPFDDAMNRECSAERSAVVEGLDDRHDVFEALDKRVALEVVSRHELSDLGADSRKLAKHWRTHAKLAGSLRSFGFTASVDAQQLGALARNSDDEFVVAYCHHKVAVGDAAGERMHREFGRCPCRHATHDPFDLGVHPARLSRSWYLGGVKSMPVRNGESGPRARGGERWTPPIT